MAGQSPDWPVDEFTGLSAGGRYIHWNLCENRSIGGFDVSKPNTTYPNSSSSRQWRYIQGEGELPVGYDVARTPYLWHPTSPANLYWSHIDDVGPAIYAGKLYVIRSNALIAFSQAGAGETAPILPMALAPAGGATADTIPVTTLKARLAAEVQKIVNAGHLKPGYGITGNFDSPARLHVGDHLLDYWHNPADIILTLLKTLPHLSPTLQASVETYVQSEFAAFPPHQYAHIGWKDGAWRDPFTFPAATYTNIQTLGPATSAAFSGWALPPQNFYAMWKYAEHFGDTSFFTTAVKNLLKPPPPDAFLLEQPDVHNAYIAGYHGYVELAKLTASPYASQQTELNRLLALRSGNFTWDVRTTQTGSAGLNYYLLVTAWNFMNLVPELADHLAAQALPEVQAAITKYSQMAPYWMVSHNKEVQGENGIMPLYQTQALFQARAQILGASYSELLELLDTPVYPVGDLFYLDNLVATIEAAN
jgi:hypothetical protein